MTTLIGQGKGFSNGAIGGGRTLHVAGQIGAGADLIEQFGAALDAVLAVVKEAGGAPEDIASMTVYVTDMKYLDEITPARLKYFPKDGPASAIVQVGALAFPELKVEIEGRSGAPAPSS